MRNEIKRRGCLVAAHHLWENTVNQGEYDKVILPYIFNCMNRGKRGILSDFLFPVKQLLKTSRKIVAAGSGLSLGAHIATNLNAGLPVNLNVSTISEMISPPLILTSLFILGINWIIDKEMKRAVNE